jgi:hypothetical protein
MRRTPLKPDKSGQYYRNLGWKRTRTGHRGQHKFLLGTNKKEAESRNALLERLWQSIEERDGEGATWSEFTLNIGIAFASGKTEVLIERGKTQSYIPGVESCHINDATYARQVNDA